MKIRFILILFFLFLSSKIFGQSYNSYFHQFEFKYHWGVSLPHHTYLNYIIKDRIMIGEINYSIKTDGSKVWHQEWRCPELGGGFQFAQLGNRKILGFANSVFVFYGVPIVETEHFILKYRIGAGLAYITKTFNNDYNNLNIAIGSHLNAHIQISVITDIKPFNIPLYFSPGFTFNHYSAGAMAFPNLGINQLTLNMGVKYLYCQYPYSLLKGRRRNYNNLNWEFSFSYLAAVKKNDIFSPRYFINNLSADFALRVSFKRAFGLGTSVIFDPSLKEMLEGQNKYSGTGDLFRLGFHGFQELYWTDNLSCIIQFGGYAYNKYYTNLFTWFYLKIGVKYTFKHGVFANIFLKTRNLAADCIEFGGGYKYVRD
ncbi:MAG: acyloxyacyl hydrolase [Bacteroidales bacterium]|jgi:hypothetical protein|nr:acyloxyacyl hydrolase [Bacteroidales bacterium]